MVLFDSTKPASSARFNSQELRNNFQALSRANDLRCRASDPADLNVNVEPGIFSLSSTTATQFAGDSVTIDTTTGGAAGQERIFVVEITEVADGYGDIVGQLVLNTNGLWASAGAATAPAFTIGNIGLCTVLVAYQDVAITDDQITDVRPIVNLGSAAIPPAGLFLADLQDVDGLQSAAFQAADSPTGVNPFLTPTTAPIPTLLSDVSSLLTDTSNHFAGTGDRHTAADIDIVDNFSFTNETDVQSVLDDVETNIYQQFLDEHNADGTHGPKVTITQTNADNVLNIVQNNTSFTGGAVNVTNNGPGQAVDIEQNFETSTSALSVVQTEDNLSGGAIVLFRMESDFGEVLHVENALETHNTNQRIARFTQAGQGGVVLIDKTNTNSDSVPGSAFQINDSTPVNGASSGAVGRTLHVQTTGGGTNTSFPGSLFRANCLGPTIEVDALGGGVGIRVDQSGNADALLLNKTGTGSGDVVDITNSGTGLDVRGNLARWSVDAMGHGSFGNVKAGSGAGVSQGFLVLTKGATLTVTVGAVITPTHSQHEVKANTGTVDTVNNIEVSGVPDGAILVLKPFSGHTITLANLAGGSGEMHLDGGSSKALNNNDRIMLQKEGSAWYQIASFSNNA